MAAPEWDASCPLLGGAICGEEREHFFAKFRLKPPRLENRLGVGYGAIVNIRSETLTLQQLTGEAPNIEMIRILCDSGGIFPVDFLVFRVYRHPRIGRIRRSVSNGV